MCVIGCLLYVLNTMKSTMSVKTRDDAVSLLFRLIVSGVMDFIRVHYKRKT